MFEISDREVWSRVANDKEGLKEYFATHRSDYKWDEYKYKGVVVRCKEEKLGKEIKRKLKKVDYSQWSDSIAKLYDSDGSAVAEYGLFSCGDNDIVDLMVYHSNVTMTADGYPFAYVYGKKQKGPANDEEAGEALVSDYHDYLEKTWIDELRRDSRVEIKQEVLKTVNNH
jgi:peptidyl-prolyl cis-trans isomerase SurA